MQTSVVMAAMACVYLRLLGVSAATEFELSDEVSLSMPLVGAHQLRILSPTLLELTRINSKLPEPARVDGWDFIDASLQLRVPAPTEFAVLVNGQETTVQAIGFKRRPLYAPLRTRDLRIANSLYLRLPAEIGEGQTVEVRNPGGTLWPTDWQFRATADRLRYSPAIHVNEVGYLPSAPKTAMIGYYLGNLGEMEIPAGAGFKLVDARTGAEVFNGSLRQRPDDGYLYSPKPYQKVWEADFTGLATPGEYRIAVAGLGACRPFVIDEGVAMAFARAYALGLYHQRCGMANELPYTRFTHGPCHTAMAEVPDESFVAAQRFLAEATADFANNPLHSAPRLLAFGASLYPFVNRARLDVSGGHHDAGDYSKYTINSAALIHLLVFAVDALPGVSELDNLGLPESGDGISDLLQEAKWEADFLAKMQDADGGFYFLVYPRDRAYENDVLPDQGDRQVVWPKNTAASAAAVAALAQCASSPIFRKHYPVRAAEYLEKAKRGWAFLADAIARYGKQGAYQKEIHYGNEFMHDDELAWAMCEMYLATGEQNYHQQLLEWFDPAGQATRRWTWWRLFEGYGNAVRSYAFAAKSGRLEPPQLEAAFLAKCEEQIREAGNDVLNRSRQNAYGTSFPVETKRIASAGWYFSVDQVFDVAVASALTPNPAYLRAFLHNLNYEAGCNPVNVSYVTGLGSRRQREIVHQYALNDRRVLPPSGLPIGNIQDQFPYLDLYGGDLGKLTFPSDGTSVGPYPFYDRWADTFNVMTEFTIINQARCLAGLAFLAAQTSLKNQPWKPVPATIRGLPSEGGVNSPITASLEVAGLDLARAQVVWEARGQEPAFGTTYAIAPTNHGVYWIEVEAQWPDGRRVFGATKFNATNSLPTLSVVASDPEAAEDGRNPGTFMFSRTEAISVDVTAMFLLTGSAARWDDYRTSANDVPDSIHIPADATSVTLTFAPMDDSVYEGYETVRLQLVADPAYNIATPREASITIADNDTQVVPPNASPTISDIADRSMTAGATPVVLGFSVSDAETAPELLTVSARSSNSSLVPDANITVSGSGANRTLSLVPLAGQVGTTVVTITVSDGTKSVSDPFVLMIESPPPPPPPPPPTPPPPNSVPTISLSFDEIALQGAPRILSFRVGDAETSAVNLIVRASSTNTDLLPSPNLVLSGNGTDRTMTLTAVPKRSGTATVSLSVTDASGSTTHASLRVTVEEPKTPLVLGKIPDQFTEANRPLPPLEVALSEYPVAAEALVLTANSSNPDLVPPGNILFGNGAANPRLVVVPARNQAGTAEITVTVSDGVERTSTSFVLTVGPVDTSSSPSPPPSEGSPGEPSPSEPSANPPSVSVLSVTTTEDTSMILWLGDDYRNGIPLVYTMLTLPTKGVLSGQAPVLIYTPNPNETGFDSFSFAVSADGSDSSSAAVNINITPVNDPPTISVIEDQKTFENRSTPAIRFSVADAETAAESLVLTAKSDNETLAPVSSLVIGWDGSGRNVVIKPATGQAGAVTLTLSVADSENQIASQSFRLVVEPAPIVEGDFSGDGKPDLVFQNPDGIVATWMMDGVDLQSVRFFNPSHVGDAGYQVAGSGDFNSDGRQDLLFQHASGTCDVWFIEDFAQVGNAQLSPSAPDDPRWRVVATGDLNRDRRTDIVFQHQDGTLAVWYMDGTKLSSASLLDPSNPGDTNWRVACLGDLDGDGNPELFFQHSDGSVAAWRLQNSKLFEAFLIVHSEPDVADWRLAGALDVNSDGKAELLFQHRDSGLLAVWHLDGHRLNRVGSLNPMNPGVSWRVVVP